MSLIDVVGQSEKQNWKGKATFNSVNLSTDELSENGLSIEHVFLCYEEGLSVTFKIGVGYLEDDEFTELDEEALISFATEKLSDVGIASSCLYDAHLVHDSYERSVLVDCDFFIKPL